MEERGLEEGEILEELFFARKKDLKYSDGRILSSMCTSPHPFSERVYELFKETNLGDPGLFKGTRELETKAIRALGSLLNHPEARGFILSGGTEANIIALWAARNEAKKKRPEVVMPEFAHFSFEKAADLLHLKLVKARKGEDNSVDPRDAEKKITENTVAVVGIAGSTEYGTIDDIEALSEIAVEEDIHLHVDAAFGGFVIPFLRDLGYGARKFDFSLPGVSSMTVDPHKMGLAPIPSGGILFRDEELLKYVETPSPYLTEKVQHTLLGTRSGASAAVVFALLKLMGKEGYRENVRQCMVRTMGLYSGLKKLGLEVYKPTMNILVFGHEEQERIAERLSEKGWVVSRTRKGEIRMVIMPHVTEKSIEEFTADLGNILKGL
jgi:tyrosine decarboxylase/aspartate 1-decarboxylase